MKTCGIEIDKNEVVIVCLESQIDGTYEVVNDIKKIPLPHDDKSDNIWNFFDSIVLLLDNINADKIAIIKLHSKGRFHSSPISFKIQALIQLYRKKEIQIIDSKTIEAHSKKHQLPFETKFKYQALALKLCYYLSQ
jgi:hypothetical protein